MVAAPFWRTKSIQEFSPDEWEALCDGCAKCCLVRLRDDDSDEIASTNVACKLLDQSACRCIDYRARARIVPGCVQLSPENIAALDWMPPTCAYRLVAAGRDLPWWHHLISGSRETVHEAGASVRGRTVSENDVSEEDLWDHVATWPDSDELVPKS